MVISHKGFFLKYLQKVQTDVIIQTRMFLSEEMELRHIFTQCPCYILTNSLSKPVTTSFFLVEPLVCVNHIKVSQAMYCSVKDK